MRAAHFHFRRWNAPDCRVEIELAPFSVTKLNRPHEYGRREASCGSCRRLPVKIVYSAKQSPYRGGLYDRGAMLHLINGKGPTEIGGRIALGSPASNRIAGHHTAHRTEPPCGFKPAGSLHFAKDFQQVRCSNFCQRPISDPGMSKGQQPPVFSKVRIARPSRSCFVINSSATTPKVLAADMDLGRLSTLRCAEGSMPLVRSFLALSLPVRASANETPR
jgi:hypothetical protein